MRPLLLVFVFFLLNGCKKETIDSDLGVSFTYEPKEIRDGVRVGEIYKTGNFAAFTDLAYFNQSWFAVFRVGTEHVGGINGQIKILRSDDAMATWKIEKIIEIDSLDLRDPKLAVDSLNKSLYINFFGSNNNTVENFLISYNDRSWGTPYEITYDDQKDKFVFWRLTYRGGKMYCAAYRTPIFGGYSVDNIGLFEGEQNFRHYKTLGRVELGGSANEATVRFDDNNKMYFLIRAERTNVALGFASAPNYNKVKWLNTASLVRLASPNFLIYKGKLIITGRDVEEKTFKLFYYDPITSKVIRKFTFPSGYETGYGGMSFNPANKNELLITYYSITSSKSYIELARIDLEKFLQ